MKSSLSLAVLALLGKVSAVSLSNRINSRSNNKIREIPDDHDYLTYEPEGTELADNMLIGLEERHRHPKKKKNRK